MTSPRRVAIVTGAASGIGRATAELLAREGTTVVAADIAAAAPPAAGDETGSLTEHVVADVTRAEDCDLLVQRALGLGGVDVVVNCAGIIRRADVVATSEAEWDRLMDVNVKSIYLLSRAVIPAMRAGGGGAIVNVASAWGLAVGADAAAYCASKGAVVQLTRAMAVDHAADGIRINCVCPGDVETPMLAAEARELGCEERTFRAAAADRPARRAGRPEEVAELIVWLAGPGAGYVTGAAVPIDGGGLLG